MINNCGELHRIASKLHRHSFPFELPLLPKDGIYLLFENGETGHTGQRIVRVGTHTGALQLPSRLFQHFIQENKDRSIFRKNIGRALLRREQDSFLEQWELDLTTREAKNLYAARIDTQKQRSVERRVTDYIQTSFSFVVLPVELKQDRLRFESRFLSTLSLCHECGASEDWLGRHSPKERIRESGLWNVNELYKTPLSAEDLELILCK